MRRGGVLDDAEFQKQEDLILRFELRSRAPSTIYGRVATQSSSAGHLLAHSPDTIS